MNYIPLSEYKKAWIFRHRDLPLSAEDLEQIKPMTEKRAAEVWSQNVSRQSTHYTHFCKGDWAGQGNTWEASSSWQGAWDSDDMALPEELAEFIQWDDNTVVYFCYESDHVIQTTWEVFKRAWKNFLFMDDGPLLIGRKRKEVAQFFENGQFKLGRRP